MCVVYVCVCVCVCLCEGRWRSGVCGGRRKEIMCVHMYVCGCVDGCGSMHCIKAFVILTIAIVTRIATVD